MNTEAENKTNEYLKGIVANLPEKPGIYQYLNAGKTQCRFTKMHWMKTM